MEYLSVVAGNFAAFFFFFTQISEHFLVHISGSSEPITLIWISLKTSFPPAELGYR